MADKEGVLSEDERQKLRLWLIEHAKGTQIQCPICKSLGWDIQPHIVEQPVRVPGQTVLGGAVYPFGLMMCRVCGHTLFINAIKAGLVLSDEEEKAKLDAAAKAEEAAKAQPKEVSNG